MLVREDCDELVVDTTAECEEILETARGITGSMRALAIVAVLDTWNVRVLSVANRRELRSMVRTLEEHRQGQ